MTVKDIASVLTIFNKYGDFEATDLAADHEQIWIGGPELKDMSEEDQKAVDKLGWFEDEDSWSHFC